jgi:hypothetical protein
MALSVNQVVERIDGLHLDELDLRITHSSAGFAITDNQGELGVESIGSNYEVPDFVDEHGRVAFTVGPWTAYQYHSSYVASRRDNYEGELDQLAAGELRAVIVGVTAITENDTWVLGIRTEN